MIHQPHAFEAVTKGYFYQRAREMNYNWHVELLKGKDSGPQNIVYGILDPQEIALQPGITSLMLDVSSFTAFTNLLQKNVQLFITLLHRNTKRGYMHVQVPSFCSKYQSWNLLDYFLLKTVNI
jgi:hypothetical protein